MAALDSFLLKFDRHRDTKKSMKIKKNGIQ